MAGAVARARLQRAFQHRYCPGGQGRRGALREIRRAIAASPRTMLRVSTVVYGLVAALCPAALIGPLRSAVLARKYPGLGAAAPEAAAGGTLYGAETRHAASSYRERGRPVTRSANEGPAHIERVAPPLRL